MKYLGIAMVLVLAAPASGERLFVTSNVIQVVDGTAGTVVGSIDLGRSMVRDIVFSADGATAYVAHSSGVSVVDVASQQVRATWSDRVVTDLALRESEGKLYTLQHKSGEPYEIVVYDVASGQERTSYEVDHRALDISVPGAGERVYTTNIHRATVSGYDRLSGEARGSTPISSATSEADLQTYIVKSLVSSDGRSVYVVMNGENAGIRVVDALTGEPLQTISLGHPAYVRDAVLSPDGTRAYLSAIDHLSVVDLASGKEIAWAPIALPHQGIAISPQGDRLYVANPIYEEGGSVTIVDASSFEVVGRVEVPEISPFRVAVVP
jgi:DNA-binding beta-propeller fold protein YncE